MENAIENFFEEHQCSSICEELMGEGRMERF